MLVMTVIEISKGSRFKYEWKNGGFRLSRFTERPYPAAYGFVPGTKAEDGDPLDVLVLTVQPLDIGDVLRTRPVGVLAMTDHGYRDHKILAVDPDDPAYGSMQELTDVPVSFLADVLRFYMEMGKVSHGWRSRNGALEVIRELTVRP